MLALKPRLFFHLILLIVLSNYAGSIKSSSQTSLHSKPLWTLTTPAWPPGGFIPTEYTSYGENINPPLFWNSAALPKGTKSLAIIVDDPDAPNGTFTHWLVKDIPVELTSVAANSTPGVEIESSWNYTQWGGPKPPNGTHRYFFQLYAMPTPTINATDLWTFYDEVRGTALGAAVYMGRVTAPPNSTSPIGTVYYYSSIN